MYSEIFLTFYFCLGVIYGIPIEYKEVKGPLTPDFVRWLEQNGYENYSFDRPDLGPTGSYGGRSTGKNSIDNQPIVFVHGNSDGALAIPGNYSSGWTNSISYFLEQGYTSAELYATTWGDRNPDNAKYRSHTCEYLLYIRRFIEAVLKYTGAPLIDIVTHSMGVTLTRRAIKGGTHFDLNGLHCKLGPSLTKSIDSFLGISGANLGMCTCSGYGEDYAFPTCNLHNGFWPGNPCGNNKECGNFSGNCSPGSNYSKFLAKLNMDDTKEGNYVYSTWSKGDDILMNQCQVYGRSTSLILDSTDYKIYNNLTHMQTKELTAKDQYMMIVLHVNT